MKATLHPLNQPLLLLILAFSTWLYFRSPVLSAARAAQDLAAQEQSSAVIGPRVILAQAPARYARWKTGPSAQNDWATLPAAQPVWATGPNAQTDFEPFAPSEQAHWNDSPGYTIIAGRNLRR